MRMKIKKEIIWHNEKVIPNFTENVFWAFIKEFQDKFRDVDYMT